MEQEYTISTGWKIFMISVAIFLIGFSIFLFSMGTGINNSPIIFLIPISILALSGWVLLTQIRGKIIVSSESITRINAFSTKELAIKYIAGCRIGDKSITIKSNTSNNSRILINNYDVYSNSDELVAYLKENFKNIDAIDLKNEKERVFDSSELGFSESDKNAALKRMKIIYITYNIIGAILCFAMIPVSNQFASIVMLSYPLIGIVVMRSSKGLIKFVSNSKRSVYGFIMLGFILPSFIMFIKGMGEYDISSYQNLWIPFIAISLIIFISILVTGLNKSIGFIAGQVIIMLIAAMLFGYGSVIQINCVFDKSTPAIAHSTIADKWKEYSKGEHYNLKLNSWDSNYSKQVTTEVSEATYNKYTPGDKIDVETKAGVLNIPWFTIAR